MRRFATPLDADALAAIADCLRDGGVALMPTDTVYGIAAHPDRPDALARLFALKGRDASKPVPLLADSLASVLRSGLRLSPAARRAAARFWPGALTLVLDRPDGGTDGVRVPAHATARALCAAAGGLLRCTSANASGQPPAHTAAAAAAALPEADILVDGGSADGDASTVAQLTATTLRLFRPGPVSEDALKECLDESLVARG
ncbi:MAG: L-threonylcarbamoyladenylate synthase [Kiritimatiellia bacterium]|jgi:L-threonylcarbamoyladenylate synthase